MPRMSTAKFVRAVALTDLRSSGCLAAQVDGHTLALFAHGDRVYAVDNRCPHMGFPLHQGSVKDGILTCHWHHARFDLASGGTFDQFADDVRAFPVEIRGDEVWVDVAVPADSTAHFTQRLCDGLERNIPLVIAKAVIALTPSTVDAGAGDGLDAFRAGVAFGARYRQRGWGQGLTIHTCMVNLLPHLAPEDRPRALYHGLSAVARDCEGMAPRFVVQPLPTTTTDLATLKRWFRRFIEVRDSDGAERCVVSAVRAGADPRSLADMLFAAATDHRYIQIGHPLDFTNKAMEALDVMGWAPESTELVLTSLVTGYAFADRMEESNSWRNPVDLIAILEHAFERLEAIRTPGAGVPGSGAGRPGVANGATVLDPVERDRLVALLLGDDPQATVDGLLAAIGNGVDVADLAQTVAYAAALRIARFHTSNEFGDWDTALHTFTFANAVHQGLRRLTGSAERPELTRGIFDAAMSVYLDRFLNVPPARLPVPGNEPAGSLDDLPTLFDRQQQVDQAGEAVARALYGGTNPGDVIATLGRLLLREDRDFHTIQCVEAAVRLHALLQGTPAAAHALVAAARYLAAHAPTVRAQGQTFQIAQRLAHGDNLFEGAPSSP